MHLAGCVLCGGASLRMGFSKPFIEYEKGLPLYLKAKQVLAEFCEPIVISIMEKDKDKYKNESIIYDLFEGHGPISGIYSVIKKLNSDVFVLSCDMPFISEEIIKVVLKYKDKYDVVLCKTPKGIEPLCGIYSVKCLPFIKKQIEINNNKIIDFFPQVNVKLIQVEKYFDERFFKRAFLNLNRPGDLKYLTELKYAKS